MPKLMTCIWRPFLEDWAGPLGRRLFQCFEVFAVVVLEHAAIVEPEVVAVSSLRGLVPVAIALAWIVLRVEGEFGVQVVAELLAGHVHLSLLMRVR